jgi:protein-S-isoprenylcysteine O-methyltransferase Ste14
MNAAHVMTDTGKSLVPLSRKLQLVATLAVILPAMFAAAGTFTWLNGWIFWGLLLISVWIGYLYLRRANPEVIVARSVHHSGTKTWDKWILGFLSMLLAAELIVAPLDAVRYRFWPLAVWLVLPGVLLFLAGFFLTLWAEGVNKFFEPTVRIQSDRGHYVVSAGPYAVVRHPGYVGTIALLMGSAMVLGSGLAVILSAVSSVIFVVRTALEDRMLLSGLSGYRDYAEKVRYRLLPGVW